MVYSKKKDEDWFRLKQYPHIGLQLKPWYRVWVEPYVKDDKAIAKHAFYPFIHRQIIDRRFRRQINKDGTRAKHRIASISKPRDIHFSNHLDSKVFGYYSELLAKDYENLIEELDIGSCITAYRRIKLKPEDEECRNKCNIDFANDVFQHIKQSKGCELVAITFDIKGFFDNLDHKQLKRNWRRVIGSGIDLPPDHYNVYRNITKFSYVEEDDLFNHFKDRIVVERQPNRLKEIVVDKKRYMRDKRAVAYCYKESIDEIRKAGLIKTNKRVYEEGKGYVLRGKGIPQGSPISATLANIYMIDFDKNTHDYLKRIGGVYQRYSDDMVVICPVEYEDEVIEHFMKSIKEYKLEIQQEKTQVFHFLFDKTADRHFCYEKNRKTDRLQNNTFFEYLGFQFDGFYTMIKNASISNYYRKMKRDFARSWFYTYHNTTDTKGEVFKNRLYKRHTHLGANRRQVYKRDSHKTNVFRKSHKYDWGNFITYAQLSEKTIPDNKIGGQVKGHWRKFNEMMREIEEK